MTTRIPITLTLLAGLTLAGPTTAADRDDELRLVVPPWPGVTVKSEILAQLIEPLGYTASKQQLSSTVGYNTLQTGDSDAFLAGWLPAQQESYDAAMQADAIIDLATTSTAPAWASRCQATSTRRASPAPNSSPIPRWPNASARPSTASRAAPPSPTC